MGLTIGETLQGRYRVDALLGKGGMGAVYQAWDNRLNVTVALKEMTPQPGLDPHLLAQLRQQFQQEANVLARLDHPHLVRVIDFFEGESNGYLVMDFVEGESLAERIEREGVLPEEEVLGWAGELLDALAYCHSQGVIHRDVKPQNLIIRDDGRVVLVDFGLVKLWDPDDPHTRTAMRGMGTPEYAPPEQYDLAGSHTDPRSDIYSVGATLYHVLTGETPPSATQRMVNPASLKAPKALNEELTAHTERAVLIAMEPQPEHRFQSAGEMAAVLAGEKPLPARRPGAQMGPTGTTMMPGAVAAARGRRLRGRLVWVGVGLVVLVGLGWWLARPESPLMVALASPTLTVTVTLTPTPTLTPTLTPTPSPTPTPTPMPLAWQRIYGGALFPRAQVDALAVDPQDSDVLYAATGGAGIYRSLDGGVSWQPAHAGLGSARVADVVIRLDRPQTLFARVLPAGVYRSDDRGDTWTLITESGMEDSGAEDGLGFLALDPSDSSRLYYSPREGLWVTEEDEGTWRRLSAPPCGAFLTALAPHPTDADVIYVATVNPNEGHPCEPGLFRSEDGGQHWEHLPLAPVDERYNMFPWRLAINPADPAQLYASQIEGPTGIQRSTDGGLNWVTLDPDLGCNALLVPPYPEGWVYCAGSDNIAISTDGGVTWRESHPAGEGTWMFGALAIDPRDGLRIYAGGPGVYHSTNGGQTWQEASSGLGNGRLELSVDPSDGRYLYACYRTDFATQFYRSDDGGYSWESPGAFEGGGCGLTFEPGTGALLMASGHGEEGRIWHSADRGQTWEHTIPSLPQGSNPDNYPSVLVNPQDTRVWYWMNGGCDEPSSCLSYSLDGGETWQVGLGGHDWNKGRNPRLLSDAGGEVLYLVMSRGVAKSSNGGINWTRLGFPWGDSFHRRAVAAISPLDPDVLYVGRSPGGVYCTQNGGETFEEVNSGLTNLFVNALAVHPSNPDIVYAGTDGGAFISFDGGDHWGRVTDGLLGATVIYDIKIDPNDPSKVYAATPYGIFLLEED